MFGQLPVWFVVILWLTAHSPGIEDAPFVEELGSFGKELPALIIPDLKGGEVVNLVIGRYLSKIGDQGHVECETLIEPVFQVGAIIIGECVFRVIRRILKHIPQARQTLLFSATMPADIRKLTHEVLSDPVTVQAGSSAPTATVSHALYSVEQHLKTALLLELLNRTDTGSVLVFTRTKHRAKRLGEQLEKAGHRAASLQGNLSQNRRQAALEGFRNSSFQILVATDIAARGIDVSQVSHVINYDIPDTVEAYIHRIGRTGRAARSGDAFTLVTRDDKAMVRSIERTLGSPLESRTLEGFNYNVPAPSNATEFARPPRQSQPVDKPGMTGKGGTKHHKVLQQGNPPLKATEQSRQKQGRKKRGTGPSMPCKQA